MKKSDQANFVTDKMAGKKSPVYLVGGFDNFPF
jgi:hypothetical protein